MVYQIMKTHLDMKLLQQYKHNHLQSSQKAVMPLQSYHNLNILMKITL